MVRSGRGHRDLREPLNRWIAQSKSLRSSQCFEAFIKAVPNDRLKSAQEEYIRQGKPGSQQQSVAVAAASSSGMSQQSGRPPGQQAAAAAAQQLRYGAATPPVGQQFQTNNNAWANSQLVPLQHGRVSPGPGQPVIAAAAAGQQALQQLQLAQYLQSQGLIAPGTAVTAQQLQALFQRQQQQAQAQAHMARAAQQQQQANQAGKRPVAVPAAAAAAPQAAAKKHIPLATVGSAGSLPALVQHGSNQQATARLGAAQNLAAVAGVGQRPLQAGGLAMQGIRPGVSIPAAPGVLGVAAAGLLGAPGIAQQAVQTHATLEARQHMAQLKPGEQPRLQLPDTHEWVQCLGKDGQPIWAALPRVGAQKYRAEQKRKADEAAGLQPAAKVAAVAGAGGAVRRRIDDDYTAGAGDRALDVMADDDLQAELAVNEAAKGAVQVQQGNVQEEYILNQGPILQLIAATAKKHGVRQVSEDLYAFLSLAADAHLSQLLHGLVKSRLQREDMGKNYQGVEKQDDNVRGRLFQIQKREREAAKEREQKERDELAKLSGTRKKLAEEDKKLAKEAQSMKQLEKQQKDLGTTLTKMGIGRRTFAMSAMGRPAGGPAAGPKAGFTKTELQEAKAAAADTAGAAPAANGSIVVKPEPASDADAGGQQQRVASGGVGSIAAAGLGAPPLKPVTLQHQLLTAANASGVPGGGGPVSFVAGGSGSKEGENGLRELRLRDLIAVLERHPLYCRSQLLYSLYVLAGQTVSK